MANLTDKLNNKKTVKNQSGQLMQVTDQTTNQLSAAKGLLKPINPLQATLAGANPDQAKMAGTPNQMLGLAQQDPNKLQKTLPQVEQQSSQLGSQLNREQAAAKQKSQNLQSLTTLGDRISGYIANAATQATAGQDLSKVTVAASVQDPEVQSALQGLLAGDTSKLNIAAKAVGKDPQNLSFADLKDLYNDPTGQLAGNIASLMPDQIKFSEDIAQDFGFTSQQLSEILGVPDITQYSLSDIDNLVQEESTRANNQVLSLQAKLQDPNLSPQERDALQAQLLETGYVGANVTVEEFNQLTDNLEREQEIKIGDQTLSLDELLQDPAITSFIQEYISDPESPIAKDLKERIPQLTAFVDQNRDAISAMYQQMDTSTKTAIDNFKYNLGMKNTDAGPVQDSLMDLVAPEWNTWTDQKKQEPNLVKYLNSQDISKEKRATLLTRANNAMQSGDTNVAKAIGSLTPEQISAYGVDDPANNIGFQTFSNAYNKVIKYNDPGMQQTIANLYNSKNTQPTPQVMQDVQKVFDVYFGQKTDAPKLIDELKAAKELSDLTGIKVNLPNGMDPSLLNLAHNPAALAVQMQANMRQNADISKIKDNVFIDTNPSTLNSFLQVNTPMLKQNAKATAKQLQEKDIPNYTAHIEAQSAKVANLYKDYKDKLTWKDKSDNVARMGPASTTSIATPVDVSGKPSVVQSIQAAAKKAYEDALAYQNLLEKDRQSLITKAGRLNYLAG